MEPAHTRGPSARPHPKNLITLQQFGQAASGDRVGGGVGWGVGGGGGGEVVLSGAGKSA